MLRVLLLLTLTGLLSAQSKAPRLVVLVSVDQLATWVHDQARPFFGPEGLQARVEASGISFTRCSYAHAGTFTGPGHATVSTGGDPSAHGIIGNSWFDRQTGLSQYCCADPGAKGVGSRSAGANIGPALLLGPTLGDVMKEKFGDRARVVSLSWKDRAAVLLGGRAADVALWVDKAAGCWVSTDRYGSALPSWVTRWNATRPLDKWHGERWGPVAEAGAYAGLVDNRPFEFASGGGERTLPRTITGGTPTPSPLYYEELYRTPFGNDALMELTRVAVDAEALGKDDVPDLLCIGFSANDAGGHIFGPRSVEVRDMTLRTDALLGSLVRLLDDRVGAGRWSMVVTSDHGVAVSPEALRAEGRDGGRGKLSLEAAMLANRALHQRYGAPPMGHLRWVLNYDEACLFLDHQALARAGVALDAATKVAISGAEQFRPVQRAFSVRAVIAGEAGPEPWTSLVRAAVHPSRSGDIFLTFKPGWINSSNVASHGSAHPYDRDVPLWYLGAGPFKPGRYQDPVTPGLGVVMLCRSLQIPPPRLALQEIPEAAVR